MERDFGLPPDFVEEIPLDPATPPEPEPRRERPLGFDADPETGPWFALSMLVSVGWTALTILTLSAGREGGAAVAWALIAGFAALFVGFLAAGAAWFGQYRA
jgi:hypothetical protein